jgi:hypothetical protein
VKRRPAKPDCRPNRSIRFVKDRVEVRFTIRDPSVASIVQAFRDAQRSAVEMQVHNDELEVRRLVREKRATIGSGPGRDYPSLQAWLKAKPAKLPPRLRKRGRKPRVAA